MRIARSKQVNRLESYLINVCCNADMAMPNETFNIFEKICYENIILERAYAETNRNSCFVKSFINFQ